ncbi:hypothetical protein BCR35DRAFT_315328 [Leucosporidium creatinivorum]|uniref:F-box domain-containing protein n=1 Tax=Leucosporidium creatinivorum TaxID=106004 RepID=A0A1Y2ED00_9BASI|nr:hypothetical protein BCR35DRAFT_315328 [Leucosporidium creatinivorum]
MTAHPRNSILPSSCSTKSSLSHEWWASPRASVSSFQMSIRHASGRAKAAKRRKRSEEATRAVQRASESKGAETQRQELSAARRTVASTFTALHYQPTTSQQNFTALEPPPSRVRHLAASEARNMATVGEESSPSLPSLPTEILAHIASFLTPSLTRGWLPGSRGKQYKQWREQHKIITSLQIADRRFAAVCRPLVWRSVCFSSEDRQHEGLATLFELSDVHPLIVELRWEIPRWTYTAVAPLFLPLLTNLTSLAVLLNDEDYDYPLAIPRSLCKMLLRCSKLKSLQIDEYNAFADETFDLSAEVPELRSLTLGSWWDHEDWKKKPSMIVDLHYIEDWEISWQQADDLAVLHYLPSLQHLTLDCHLNAPPSQNQARPRLVREFNPYLAEDMYGVFSLEARSKLALETLTVTELELFRGVALVNFLQTLSPCAALRSLTFTECSSEKAEAATPWSALLMDHVHTLTIKLNAPPSSPRPLETLLGSFPNLTHLDISNGIVRQDFPPPLDTLNGLSLELRTTLEFAHEFTKLEHITLHFPESNEILRIKDPRSKGGVTECRIRAQGLCLPVSVALPSLKSANQSVRTEGTLCDKGLQGLYNQI